MKISVLTLQNISNYGSVLQAYATQVFFENLGYETEFVDYWRENMTDKNIAHDLVLNKNLKLKNVWGKSGVIRRIAENMLSKKIEREAEVFRRFVGENLSVGNTRYTSIAQLNENPPSADVYCAGSDQVWNSEWNGGFDKCFCLSYAADKPRIAFSSSFGVDKLPKEEAEQVKKYLFGFDVVTVRENSAVELLGSLGIDSTCVPDPTLLIGREHWLRQVTPEPKIKQPYILVYQLNENPDFDRIVSRAAQKLNKSVVRIEYRQTSREGAHILLPGVEDWLSYFYHADYVITDSFHGTAFSLMFQKQFVDILPGKYSERISSILRLTGLEERIIEKEEDIPLLDKEIDYKRVGGLLKNEAEKAKSIFSKVLKTYG